MVTHFSVCHVNTHHRSVQAANTLLNTHLSASLSGLCWVFLTYREDSCFHVTDVMNGAFAGLAGITPGSGFVNSQVHARSEQMIVHNGLLYPTIPEGFVNSQALHCCAPLHATRVTCAAINHYNTARPVPARVPS